MRQEHGQNDPVVHRPVPIRADHAAYDDESTIKLCTEPLVCLIFYELLLQFYSHYLCLSRKERYLHPS